MLAGTGLDDDIDFKKGMTAGFVGNDLFIESMRENCNIHTSIVDNPFEITRFCIGK